MSNGNSVVEVLLVEDNEADIALVENAFRETGGPFTLHIAVDGREALRFLEEHRARPDLVILDLNLPGINGFEILQTLKSTPDLQEIPVVIFSTSTAARDIRRAYKLSANSYVKKPADLDEFFHAVGAIKRFWMETAALPNRV